MSEERLVAEIPEDLKRLVDADPRTNKEVVRAALWTEFGGERQAALDRRIEEKERRISIIESEKNERERELEAERQELEALKAKKESMPSYEDDVKSLVEMIVEEETHIWPEHNTVKEIADREQKAPEAVISDAKEMAKEMDATVYNTQFVTAAEAQHMTKEPLTKENE